MISIADQPRKILLFYNDNGKEQWEAQQQILEAQRKEVSDRDIRVISMSFSSQNAAEWKKWNVDGSEAFTFILVGRDGGEKLRSKELVKTDKLFGLIDSMPMRKREMKDQK